MSPQRKNSLLVPVATMWLLIGSSVRGQCPFEWSAGFDLAGVDNTVHAILEFDDGSGPALYIGGEFRHAGGAPLAYVARWRDGAWEPVGTGLDGPVRALTVFDDDGAGPIPPRLVAGGDFTHSGRESVNHIARWDGQSWSPVGGGVSRPVHVLLVADLFGHTSLYVGGDFWTVYYEGPEYIARWDGVSWYALGEGVNGTVLALAAFDEDGPGPAGRALFVGGRFYTAGGTWAHSIAKWDGTTWSALGAGTSSSQGGHVHALTVFDTDGAGPLPAYLFVGGNFETAGGGPASRVVRWFGGAWSAMGSGVNDEVDSLRVFDDGTCPALYVGGAFTMAGTVAASGLARYRDAQWSAAGGGVSGGWRHTVRAMTPWDPDGPGPQPTKLAIGGYFAAPGGISANNVAAWDGAGWTAFGETENGINHFVNVLGTFDEDADGPARPVLHAGGSFTEAGGVAVDRIARWTGEGWSALGPRGAGPSGPLYALAEFDDDGPGPNLPALYVGGRFNSVGSVQANHIARWDGTQWRPVGGGVTSGGNTAVYAMAVFDDDGPGPHAPALYVGGLFQFAGEIPANDIAKWDGVDWSAVGPPGIDDRVYALAVFDDDGPGPIPPALYAGGRFWSAGGVTAYSLARWDGESWTPLGDGIPYGFVYALSVFDEDGAGPANPTLFIGGSFPFGTSGTSYGIVRWNGREYREFTRGANGYVRGMTVFDEDGPGPNSPELYVGGVLNRVEYVTASNVAKWDGTRWAALGTGVGDTYLDIVVSLFGIDDGHGPALFVGGNFTQAGGRPSSRIAHWAAVGPTFGAQPDDQAVCVGGAAAFTVGATGAGTLSYQWRRNGQALSNGGNISGAQSAALTINPVGLSDAGLYDCIVSDDCGASASQAATLAVWQTGGGDVNGDGGVDGRDVPVFTEVLLSGGPPSQAFCAADMNRDGAVGPDDIPLFVAALLDG